MSFLSWVDDSFENIFRAVDRSVEHHTSGFFHDLEMWEVLESIRHCFITGPVGRGKTLLSFALGHRCIELHHVRGIFANVKHTFASTDTVANAFVVIDEAYEFMDNRYSVDNFKFYGGWSRKTNTIWAFPSVYGIDKRVRGLIIERVADLQIIPVRGWLYVWHTVDGRKGWFILWRPERYFGTYATRQAPINDGGALDSLMGLLPEGIELVQAGRQSSSVFRLDKKIVDKVSNLENVIDSLVSRIDDLERRIAGYAVTAREEGKNVWE